MSVSSNTEKEKMHYLWLHVPWRSRKSARCSHPAPASLHHAAERFKGRHKRPRASSEELKRSLKAQTFVTVKTKLDATGQF